MFETLSERLINLECIICSKEVLYGNLGFLCISKHMKSTRHKCLFKARQNNFLLPGSSNPEIDKIDFQYGLHPMFHSMKVEATLAIPESLTPLAAMLLSFIAEKSLAFSLAPDIIELAKAVANDRKAHDKLSIHRTAASYKLRFRVAKNISRTTL